MAYKRYIKKNGKLYGPYTYHSRKENGKVISEYLGKGNSSVKQKSFLFPLIIGLILVFGILALGNFNYNFQTTGKVIDNFETPSLNEVKIAEKIAAEQLVSTVNVQEISDVEIKDKLFEKNKIMEFEVPEGKIELSFDLLDYGEFVEAEKETEIDVEGFDIEVEESSEKYKWGYEVQLTDLDFMARIDVSADEDIMIVDNQTLKVGNNYLSFADLVEAGYTLTIETPVILEKDLVNETVEIEVSEDGNETEVCDDSCEDEVETNITTSNQTVEVEVNSNETIGNETIVNETILNETEEVAPEGVPSDQVGLEEEGNETITDEVEPVINETEEIVEEEEPEESNETITGNVIRGITGFFIKGVSGVAQKVVEDPGMVSIYVQRDFSNNSENISLGDTIYLDPTLIIIEITKAEYLDENRTLISDISSDVLTLDGTWSEVVNAGEYVRATFEKNLTSSNDITVYARSVSNESAEIEVYVENGNESIAKFENILNESYYKIYLTNLFNDSYGVFDLKVLAEAIEFDLIIDPTIVHNTSGNWTGTFDNTLLVGNNITLNYSDSINGSYALTGNYTSLVFNSTAVSSLANISWTMGPLQMNVELPDNGTTDSFGMNMTGNVMMLHMNDGVEGVKRVIDKGLDSEGTWDSTRAYHPEVMKEGDIYHMWYTGYDGSNSRILYANSTNGEDWSLPVHAIDVGVNGTYDTTHAYSPDVIKIGETYHMWYTGFQGTAYHILYANSTNKINWTDPIMVMDYGEQGVYDTTRAYSPTVLYVDGIYHMWYTGYDGSHLRMLYSNSTDGINWATPVLSMNYNQAGFWDTTHAGSSPEVIKTATGYKVWYVGYTSPSYRIISAESTDGVTWTNFEKVMNVNVDASWDTTHAFSPTVIDDNGLYKMWYAGYDGTNWRILYTELDKHVMDIGTEGTYDTTYAKNPMVLKDENGLYEMWYTGRDGTNDRILYTNSTDSYNWATPVLSMDIGVNGTYDSTGADALSVIKENGEYKMWYTGYDGSTYVILYSNSSDGLDWSVPFVVMNKNQEGNWDTSHVRSPTVIKDGEMYIMWYAGRDGTNWRILYSNSSDGINWETPVKSIDKNRGSTIWDLSHASHPTVIKEGDIYRIWYAGYNAGFWRIISATSTNGINWTLPRATRDYNQDRAWDTTDAYAPSVIKDGDVFRMWYSGMDGSNWRILHTKLGTVDTSGQANDGLNWNRVYIPYLTDSGKFGNGFKFDGTNDYIALNHNNPSLQPSEEITLSAWIYPTGNEGSTWDFIRAEYSYALRRLSTGEARIQLYIGGVWYFLTQSIGEDVSLDSWNHVAGTYNGSDLKLFLNGQLVGNSSITGTISAPTNAFIGSNGGAGTYFMGKMDEVAIWNRSLADSEIYEMYKRGQPTYLNLSARTCDDENCEGEDFVDFGRNNTFTDLSSLGNNQYTQYKFDFETLSANYTPELYSVSFGYEEGTNVALTVSSPWLTSDNPYHVYNMTVYVNVTDNDVGQTINCSLSGDLNGSQTIKTTAAETIFNISIGTLPAENYSYNVTCSDGYDSAISNSSFEVLELIVNLTGTLNATVVEPYELFSVTGNVSINNGTVYSNVSYHIFINHSETFGEEESFEIANFFGDGSDGDVVFTSNTGIDTRSNIAVTASAGVTSVTLASAASFFEDDLVLFVNQQGADAGVYEFAQVIAITDNILTLDRPITNTYSSSQRSNAIRVRQYRNVTIKNGGGITSSAWDGNYGGLIAMKVSGDLVIESGGWISTSTDGYRNGVGGAGIGYVPKGAWTGNHGKRGGTWGAYVNSASRTNYQGAGGSGLYEGCSGGGDQGNGGAGGGYGTAGSNGVACDAAKSTGGSTYGLANLDTIFLGSGGGGGAGDDDDPHDGDGGNGGDGGGSMIIYAKNFKIQGSVTANGQGGSNAYDEGAGEPGSGGGGSGGAIYVKTINLIAASNDFTATGGAKGTTATDGGNGGVGRIRIDYKYINGVEYTGASQLDAYASPDVGHAVEMHYSLTNSTEDFLSTVQAPAIAGIYNISINTTYMGVTGTITQEILVNSHTNVTNVWFDPELPNSVSSTTILINVSDADLGQTINCSLSGDLNGSQEITTTEINTIFNISLGVLSSGDYSYNITCDDGLDTATFNYSFEVLALEMNVTATINSLLVEPLDQLFLNGSILLSEGLFYSNQTYEIYIDEQESFESYRDQYQTELYGDGSDGDLVVSSTVEIDSCKTSLSSTATAGQSFVNLTDASCFDSDDLILIATQQGATAGNYEFAKVISINGNDLILERALVNTYSSSYDSNVIRVPQYQDVTIQSGGVMTSSTWGGAVGGLIAFRVLGNLSIESGGSLSVYSDGYRGGIGYNNGRNTQYDGYRGDSWSSYLNSFSNSQSNGAGGAGDGNQACTVGDAGHGGGGGGHFGAGSTGGKACDPTGVGYGGQPYGIANMSKIYFGGGGGAGGGDTDNQAGYGGYGGDGGGAMIIYAKNFGIQGSISANGQIGHNPYDPGDGEPAAGGSGAGGAIYIKTTNIVAGSGVITASGGPMQPFATGRVGGAAGGAGGIRIDYEYINGYAYPNATQHNLSLTPDPVYYESLTSNRPISDDYGVYNQTIIAPGLPGTYNVTVNATIYGVTEIVTHEIIVDSFTNVTSTYVIPESPTAVDQTTIFVNVSDGDIGQTINCTLSGDFTESNTTTSDGGNVTISFSQGMITDGNYTYNVTCYDGYVYSSINNTELNVSYSLDALFPEVNITYPETLTDYPYVVTDLNYTYYETNPDSCWYSVDEGLTNTSVTCGQNITGLTANEGLNNWTVWGNDTLGSITPSSVLFGVDLYNPIVTNLSNMPANGDVGGAGVIFNWTVTDNYAPLIDCYPTIDGVLNTTYMQTVANNSNTSVAIVLSGGVHDINITCLDKAGNLNSSEKINYLVAVINVSSNVADVARIGETTDFVIDEIEGTDYLNNVTIDILNSSGKIITLNATGDPQHTVSYTWPTWRPSHLTAFFTAFNESLGGSKNVSESKNFVLLKPAGLTREPNLVAACPNETYVINGSDVKIRLLANLDTLIKSKNVTVVSPSLQSYLLSPTLSEVSNDSAGFINRANYTFNVNETGRYGVFANVMDYENQTDSWNYTFYSATGYRTVMINSSGITNMTRISRCDRRARIGGQGLIMRIANNALMDLNVSINKSTKHIRLMMRDVNLTSNVSDAAVYTALTNETDTPGGDRRIDTFEINSSLNFSNYTFEYDYSEIEYSLADENELKLWKCESVGDCTFVNTGATVNATTNILSVTLTDFSVFMLTESPVTIEIPTTYTGGGSGGGTTYVNLQLVTPGKANMELEDRIIMPITVKNPIDGVTMKGIKLTAVPNATDLSVEWDSQDIATLSPGDEEVLNMIIDSHSDPGEYQIDLTATVEDPELEQTTAIFIRLVEDLTGGLVGERIVMVKDLFRENPDCLEFNDYLIEAERILDEDVLKSKELVEFAIESCKDTITSKTAEAQEVVSTLRQRQWQTPVMVASILFALSLMVVMWLLKVRSKRKVRRELGVREDSSKKKGFFSNLNFFKSKKKSSSRKVKKDIFGK